MALFDNQPKITALRGVAADQVTEEAVKAINADLTSQGINLTVLRHSDIAKLEAQDEENTKLTIENTRLNNEVTRLGALAGEKPTELAKVQESTPKAAAEGDSKNPFFSKADAELAEMKKNMGQ